MIKLLKYLILGLVQGITEAIPVSSSGHLMIFKRLINLDIDFDTIAIVTNFGSLIAILLVFRKDIARLVSSFFKYLFKHDKECKADYKYCWLVVLGCIPAGIVGLIVSKLDLLNKIDDNIKIVGVSLIVTSILLFLIRNIKGTKEDHDITWKNALVIGIFQIIGVFPGISRSGSTIIGGMQQDLKRDSAFKYSFMLYIPMSIAAMLLEITDILDKNISAMEWCFYGLATLVALIFTYIMTKWFRSVVNKGKLIYFSIYCFIVGLLVIIFL